MQISGLKCPWPEPAVCILVVVSSGSDSGLDPSGEAVQNRLEALDHSFSFPQSALAVQLSTVRAGLTYCPEDRAFLQADWPIRAQDNPRNDVRYQVFRDLRGRGFFLTSAGKFGGDFLVYPGQSGSSQVFLYTPIVLLMTLIRCECVG